MPDFLPQPGQHVRLPVQTPRRSDFKTSSTAHGPQRRVQGEHSNVLLLSAQRAVWEKFITEYHKIPIPCVCLLFLFYF